MLLTTSGASSPVVANAERLLAEVRDCPTVAQKKSLTSLAARRLPELVAGAIAQGLDVDHGSRIQGNLELEVVPILVGDEDRLRLDSLHDVDRRDGTVQADLT